MQPEQRPKRALCKLFRAEVLLASVKQHFRRDFVKTPILLEICVDSLQSAVAAEQGGAHRVELCSGLSEGGITPSAGLIATVRQGVSLGLHVMIRPRPGDFCYDTDEFAAMKKDVLMAKQLGADGVVFGILKENEEIDSDRTRSLVEIARPLSATFHRAFDISHDLESALEVLVQAGVNRILTSGGASTAEEGVATIARLVAVAPNHINLIAAGRIRENNVAHIIATTGVTEIHANLALPAPKTSHLAHQKSLMSAIQDRESQRVVVTKDRVRRLLESASQASC